ncbi:hypothetical protein CEXT_780141 [Caerostris extrusa]|uniref:Uncharacterized protein n=1 Tax=Caerostris extrusa TaxID=172846 RepID=A0AAV4S9H0_CAEEX|nr:hypothetical protein CEXT_780141 [Caerostris extrusa]
MGLDMEDMALEMEDMGLDMVLQIECQGLGYNGYGGSLGYSGLGGLWIQLWNSPTWRSCQRDMTADTTTLAL